MFKFVNDQAEEIEQIEGQISDIQQEIDNLRDASSDMSHMDMQRRKDIKNMEQKLRQLETETEKFA